MVHQSWSITNIIYETSPILKSMILWIHEKHLSQSFFNTCLSSIRDHLPTDWTVYYSLCQVSQFGDKLDSQWYVFHISKSCQQLPFVVKVKSAGYHPYLSTDTSIPFSIENISDTHNTNIVRPTNQARVVAGIHPSKIK